MQPAVTPLPGQKKVNNVDQWLPAPCEESRWQGDEGQVEEKPSLGLEGLSAELGCHPSDQVHDICQIKLDRPQQNWGKVGEP